MFTGIIEAVGRIARIEEVGGDRRIRFEAPGYFAGSVLGDSIATNGVCLTAVELGPDHYVADLSAETLQLTTARDWQAGQAVNLERALTPSKPLGGHLVSGHVDGIGRLLGKAEDARSWRLEFEAPRDLVRYIARKGSICIEGVSLTVNEVSGLRFGVNIVPHTASHTTLGALVAGQAVNLEVDLVARYLERLLAERDIP
ncbi:MAG TPA: riboflavin synthase [Solimonas sp.]|nr:riboflavin synthase [Solimonas sp.]